MQVTIFDDGFSYDGRTPNERPLGSVEKAVVGLSEALTERGHDVVVVNRITEIVELNGVTWLPWDSPRPPSQDLVVALRKPSLLEEAEAEKCLIWMWGRCTSLTNPFNRALLEKHRPALVYVSEAQRRGWKPWRAFPEQVIEPAIGRVFREKEADGEEPSPLAVTTTHPVHGMRAIIRMWTENIRPLCPKAELHVYSAVLAKAMETSEPDLKIAAVYEDILGSLNSGIQIKRPLPDQEMASVYHRAKVHLYPVISREVYCGTLAESQASGLPAVVNAAGGQAGAARVRVRNGQTGYLAPDESAFVNLTHEILSEGSGIYRTLHRDALALQRQRSWHSAAIEFESVWK
ncbi:MAG: glycosyltransferase [Rhodospirillales bacterium]|nr:glycosyltransferase [Rhodospirillales bacterium]